SMTNRMHFSDEVADAIASGMPLLALESTIVAHGLPWPDNLAIGRDLEAAGREAGAVPATIAVFDGVAQIGLSSAQLERLAREAGSFGTGGAGAPPAHIVR